MIPQSFIQDLLNRVDIVTVVENYVQLKKAGANLLGLCPFHNEKTPSFTVSPVKQFYHCFGCGKNGSAIGFLMDYAGLGFVEAVQELAKNAGMVVPDDDPRLSPEQKAEKKAKSLAQTDALTQADQFYRQQLRQSEKAITYLKNRGLTGEVAARYGLGYAPDKRDALRAVFSDYDAPVLTESGLVIDRSDEPGRTGIHSRYDRFRGRIVFPIRNTKGQVIGFGARIIDQGEPKYLNSPETPLFQKGNELYGLFEARQAIRSAGYVLVVEGYMDVVALSQMGFGHAVATLGTACTPAQVQKLMRQTDHVVFAFDGDTAGKNAARRAMESSLPYITDNKLVSFLFLPEGHDPDSYIREMGAVRFEEAVRSAVSFSEFLFQEITKGNDLSTMEGRAKTQFIAKPLLQALQPSALRLQILRKLSELTQTDSDELMSLMGLGKPLARKGRSRPKASRPQVVGLSRQVLRLILLYPELVYELEEDELNIIEQFGPDDAPILKDMLYAAHAIGESISFAAVIEYFRMAGKDHEDLISEVAELSGLDLDKAREQLKYDISRMEVQLITAELETVLSSSRPVEEKREQYRLLDARQKMLKKQIAEFHEVNAQ